MSFPPAFFYILIKTVKYNLEKSVIFSLDLEDGFAHVAWYCLLTRFQLAQKKKKAILAASSFCLQSQFSQQNGFPGCLEGVPFSFGL